MKIAAIVSRGADTPLIRIATEALCPRGRLAVAETRGAGFAVASNAAIVAGNTARIEALRATVASRVAR